MTNLSGNEIPLTGRDLTPRKVQQIAEGRRVRPDGAALEEMARTHARILQAAASGQAIYGVTTGLGPKVGEALTAEEIDRFSRMTILGRAQALGPSLDRVDVRAAMLVRLNTLLGGASGASPDIARHIADCLNADLVPEIGAFGSVGAADLLWGGSMARALIGEGRFLGQPQGSSAAEALNAAGIVPPVLGPRDGLALVSHSGFSVGLAALGLCRANAVWNAAQTALALSLEGFRANLTPLRPEVLALRPIPGQTETADDLARRLAGSHLYHPGAARRLQDPLSIRNAVQVHATVYAAIRALVPVIDGELNGAPDNPVILSGTDEILSTGNYLNPGLTTCLVALNHALVHLASQVYARCMKLMVHRFSGLANGLTTDPSAAMAGFSPISKAAEVLVAEIQHHATPPPVSPSITADGVEDVVTHAPLAAKSLSAILDRLLYLIAIEAAIAVHAIRLRPDLGGIAPGLSAAFQVIADVSPPLDQDRSLSAEIETLASLVARGGLDPDQDQDQGPMADD